MSVDPHVESDDAAIEQAHDQRLVIAMRRLDQAVEDFKSRPTARWGQEAVTMAAISLRDEAIADIHRRLAKGGWK
jgi:hypothetical protein